MASDIAEQFSPGGWEFTPDVVDVFDEHVSASVPYYELIQGIVVQCTDWLIPDNGVYVDLGASTGTTADLIAARHPDRRVRAYLYDEVPEMLTKAVEKLAVHKKLVVEKKITSVLKPMDHLPSDLATCLFLLQFLPPESRVAVLRELRRLSKPTGALIVAEKIRPEHPLWAEIAMDVSHDFKATHGLSDSAIRAKAKSLRGVLRPSYETELLSMIEESGWDAPEILFRWHNWVVIGALAS